MTTFVPKITTLNDFVDGNKVQFDTKTVPFKTVSLTRDDTLGTLLVNKDYKITNSGYKSLLSFCKIPVGFGLKLPQDIANTLIKKGLSDYSGEIPCEVSLTDGATIHSFGEDKIKIKLEDLAEELRTTLVNDKLSSNSFVDGNTATMYGISEKYVEEPKEGDVINGGIALSINKSFGSCESSVYTNRLVCTNGMVNSDRHFSWKKNNKVGIQEFFMSVGNQLPEKASTVLESIKGLVQKPINDLNNLTAFLEQTSKNYLISAKTRGVLEEAVLSSTVTTEYDLLNSMTWEATHGGHEGKLQYDMLSFCGFAAMKMAENSSHCNSCGHTLL